mgnify:CR=1 FL=1
MLNVYEQVKRNKRRSIIIIGLFIVFVVSVGWIISQALDWGWFGIVLAILLACGGSLISYFQGDKIALAMAGAHPVTRKAEPTLHSIIENLSLVAQLPVPNVYVSEEAAPNAFACGRDPKHASICVTRGLLENLNRTEIEGVIGHEMSHIKNFDTRLFAIVSILVGTISILANFFMRSLYWRDDDRNQAGGILLIIGLILSILSPFIGQLIQLAISRRREFLADAGSAMFTRQPHGLINALEKISQNTIPLHHANPATAHFYIANPFNLSGKLRGTAKFFNTHPPVEKRIKELKKMI